MNKTIVLSIVLGLVAGAFSGALMSYAAQGTGKNASAAANLTGQEMIKQFYDVENAVHISPHSLRQKMDKGIEDFVLVDVRSAEEYEKEHIIGAVSIPAYKDKATSAYNETERIVAAFAALPKDKEIIVYCYSAPCMSGRKVGKMLAENNIFVKLLGIGWNEWRYDWNLWNHEYEWNITNVSDYVWAGKNPGTPKLSNNPGACTGQFGC